MCVCVRARVCVCYDSVDTESTVLRECQYFTYAKLLIKAISIIDNKEIDR